MKVKQLNENILVFLKKKIIFNRNIIIKNIFSLDSLYSEINEYNTKLWSKYLLTIWLIMGSLISLTLFVIISSKINNLMRILCSFGLFLFITTFLLIINTSSSVNYEANKSYKLFNSLMASNSKLYTKSEIINISRIVSKQPNNAVISLILCKFKVI